MATTTAKSQNSPIATKWREFKMIQQIIAGTPKWVFILFFVLLALGFKQSVPGRISLRRAMLLPLAMVGLSLYGTLSAFGATPTPLLAWFISTVCAGVLILNSPLQNGVRYEQDTKHFHVSGSWAPMALLIGIFLSKYLVGASTAMHPELLENRIFALGFSALNGVFAGAFLGRSIRLVRFAQRSVSQPNGNMPIPV